MAAPCVYGAINAITAELAETGIPKTHFNEVDGFPYRSIDDVLNRLAPLLAKHRLCVLPNVIERQATERLGDNFQLLVSVALRVSFALVSVDDGSRHLVEAFGEALDSGDKATSKATSAAYKTAMLQTFCIPVGEGDDPDSRSHRLSGKIHVPEPVQGWEQWARDIADIVAVCESERALDTVQDRHREMLKALSREKAELYRELGLEFTSRRQELQGRKRGVRKPEIKPTPVRRKRPTKEARSDA